MIAAAAWQIAKQQTSLAESQATSAQRQTEIAHSLEQLELQRDRPILVAGTPQVIENLLLLELANAGGGAAVRISIDGLNLWGDFHGENKELTLPGLNMDGLIAYVRDTTTVEVPLDALPEHLKAFRPKKVVAMVGSYYDTSGSAHDLDYELVPGMADKLRAKHAIPRRGAKNG